MKDPKRDNEQPCIYPIIRYKTLEVEAVRKVILIGRPKLFCYVEIQECCAKYCTVGCVKVEPNSNDAVWIEIVHDAVFCNIRDEISANRSEDMGIGWGKYYFLQPCKFPGLSIC